MSALRALCRVEEVPLGGTAVFPGTEAHLPGVFVVRLGDGVRVYENACPHIGVRLDWIPGKFLSADGLMLVCATHGAAFRREDGFCVGGPCRGESLRRVVTTIKDGVVFVPQDAGE